MKTLRFSILSAMLFVATVQAQQFSDPGWYNTQRTNSASVPDGTGLATGPATPLIQNIIPLDGGGPPVVAEAITPDIQALARGLENDPVRIFNYVHDHIKYVLYFGAKKGAEITLLEKSGNDFDQSALLVALLRAAGYSSAAYQFGWMGIPYDATDGTHNDLHHWLCLSQVNTNWLVTSNYLNNLFWNIRGYPTYYTLNDNNTFLFQRVWVTLTIGTNNYYLDPAFKVSEPMTSTNVASAMGLNTSTLLSNAQGTDAGYYVSGLNESAVRGALTGYTTNLLNFIQSNSPNASVQQILGGWYVVPSTNTTLSQSLLFQTYVWNYPGVAVMPIVNWINEPTNLMSSLAVTFAGTNFQCFIPQLEGQRLALTFSTSGLAQLWQDDLLVAQNSTSGGTYTNVILAVDHPVGNWDFVNNVLLDDGSFDLSMTNSYQRTNATYALTYAFEPDWGWLQARENVMDSYRQQGLADTSRQVVSETLNIMGLTWMLQTKAVGDALGTQLGVLQQFYNRWGRMAQEGGRGYYVDVYNQLAGFTQSGGMDTASFDREARDFDLFTYFGSALEHGIIEQLQTSNLVAASTVKMLEVASTNGQQVFLASSTNWSTGVNIQSQLINYPSATLANLGNFISAGYYVLLPKNGSNNVAGPGTWAGYAYVRHINYGGSEVTGFSISGGYQGGYVSTPGAVPNTPYVATTVQSQPTFFTTAPVFAPALTGADPVDLADGTFQLEAKDLSIGQQEPRGINLTRYYNGRRRFTNPAGMAGGWIHNYNVSAVECSAPQAGLGSTTPAQMAPMLAAITAAVGLYNDTGADPKNWMVTALIAKWGIDQLTRNGIAVSLGSDNLQFVKQPDGRFTPPANCIWTLSKSAIYTAQQRHGNSFTFDSLGRLTNIVDQYNQSLNLTYNSSNWVQTVTDWKGRSLTFTYSGSPQRLTSVSDSLGRSVSYGYSTTYNSQGDLVSFTDAESKTNGYSYDTNHQITATFDGLGRLVVSNIYDAAGHVATQNTQGDTNKAWQVYWSGWQTVEIDPAGARQVTTYDDKTRPISSTDALGSLSQTFYDGQDHIVMTISPLHETNQMIYDGNNNLIYTIDPLNLTNQNVYDNQNNLVRSIDPRGSTSRFGYNSQFSVTGTTNGAGDWKTFSYNSDGTLYSQTDSGGTTTFGYDSYGQRNSVTYPNSLGVENLLNSPLGDVTNRTNPRGFALAYQYNARRELTNTIAPTNVSVKISFDAADNQQTRTDARGFTTTSFWTPTHHLSGTVLPATPQGTPTTTNFYDSRDLLVQTVDPLLKSTLLTNDLAGHLMSSTDPLLRTTSFGYDADGRKTVTTNAALEKTALTWDARGQMTKLTDPATNIVRYAFDGAGNRIFLTNRNGKVWQFQFDGANRVTNTLSPLQHSIKQVYNDRGLLQSVTQPNLQSATFSYDAKGRKLSQSDSVGTINYQYDANNNMTNASENGRTNSWTFDAYDRMSSYRDSDGNLIQYRCDANGNVTNVVYPGNRNVYYFFDSLDRLTNVTDWANRQTVISYDLANRVTSILRPNGTLRTINYDAAGEMTNVVEKTLSGFPIAFFRFNWDNAKRMQWEFAAPLPHSNSVPPRTMTYDDDNRIAYFNGVSVGYDLNGNLTSGPLTNSSLVTYTYDARNRLVTAGGIGYTYDPAGNRIALTNGAAVTHFVMNPNSGLPQVLMRTGNGTTNYYIYGQGLLYEVTETATSTNMLTYHFDYRGSTIAITDKNGNVTDRIEYSAYGLITFRSGNTDTPFLYNGRYGVMTDPNGLLYMRARFYNPYICRFINPDPSGFAGGLNWYCYADGNPVNELDPFGLGAWTSFFGGLRAVGGLLEAGAGYGLATASVAFGAATSWTGVGIAVGAGGAVGGVAIGAHGLDQAIAGFRQAFSGEQVDSFTSGDLQMLGMSKTGANLTDAGISIVGSAGAGLATAGVKTATTMVTDPLAQGMNPWQVFKGVEQGSKALSDADYWGLGGDFTSPLYKAAQMADNPYMTSTTYWQSVAKAFTWNMLKTGPTPGGNIGVGALGAGFNGLWSYGNYGSGVK